jgi:SAM-dependent methyltransferase
MSNVSRVWQNRLFARTVGASYDWAFERGGLATRFGRLVMGADLRRVYDMMDIVGEMPDGSSILDVPCGGGITTRRLRDEQRVRYVAMDISPAMLARARGRLPSTHLDRVEFVEGDIERMPFADDEFDLCVCFNGFHCLPDPGAAPQEIARCLRPGGRLVGNFAVRNEIRRADAYMAILRTTGTFGPAGTVADARRWFDQAGLKVDMLECSGAIAYFSASKPH